MSRLTDASLKTIKPQAQRFEVSDAVVGGLRLAVHPSGARSWIVRYRHGGKQHKLTLGSYPRLTLADARSASREALRAVAAGRNPSGEKKEARAASAAAERDVFERVYEEYKRRHIEKNLKPGVAHDTKKIFDRALLPRFGKKRLAEITRGDIARYLDDTIDRGAPAAANRTFAALRHFLNYAVSREYLAVSPANGLKPPVEEKARDRVLSDDELRWIWVAANEEAYPFGRMVQLLMLTGARRDEVRAMTDKEVSVADRLWKLPASRTKNSRPHEVFVSDTALSIIEELPTIQNKAGYIFCTNGETPISGFSRAKARIAKRVVELAKAEAEKRGDDPEKVEITDWRLHDLRRTVASGMARIGIALPVIERCLNHISGSFGGIVGVYQRHKFSDEMRAAFQAWGQFVAETVEGRHADKIIPMQKRKAERRAASH